MEQQAGPWPYAFEFQIGDRVIIKAIDHPGTIDIISVGIGKVVQYRVAFWNELEDNVVWLQADQIELAKDKGNIAI